MLVDDFGRPRRCARREVDVLAAERGDNAKRHGKAVGQILRDRDGGL